MKKSLLVMICAFMTMVAISLVAQSCKAQRTISATGYTIVSHDNSQSADSVRCSFKLEEKYSGVQTKK